MSVSPNPFPIPSDHSISSVKNYARFDFVPSFCGEQRYISAMSEYSEMRAPKAPSPLGRTARRWLIGTVGVGTSSLVALFLLFHRSEPNVTPQAGQQPAAIVQPETWKPPTFIAGQASDPAKAPSSMAPPPADLPHPAPTVPPAVQPEISRQFRAAELLREMRPEEPRPIDPRLVRRVHEELTKISVLGQTPDAR